MIDLSNEATNYDKVTKLMLSFKFQPQMQGFDYLRSAILYHLNHDRKVGGVTTEVYPILATQYNTKEASIERSIRKIIEKSFESGGLLSINYYFDAIVYTNKFKFSNNEIIAIFVEIIKLDNLKRQVCRQMLDEVINN